MLGQFGAISPERHSEYLPRRGAPWQGRRSTRSRPRRRRRRARRLVKRTGNRTARRRVTGAFELTSRSSHFVPNMAGPAPRCRARFASRLILRVAGSSRGREARWGWDGGDRPRSGGRLRRPAPVPVRYVRESRGCTGGSGRGFRKWHGHRIGRCRPRLGGSASNPLGASRGLNDAGYSRTNVAGRLVGSRPRWNASARSRSKPVRSRRNTRAGVTARTVAVRGMSARSATSPK